MASSRSIRALPGSRQRFFFVLAAGGILLACTADETETATTVSVPTSPSGTGTVASTSTSNGTTDSTPNSTSGGPDGDSSTTVAEGTTTSASTPPTDQPTTTTTDTEQDMEVYFAVEGGFANQMRSMTFGADGQAEIEISGRSSQRVLASDVVDAITTELDRSGLFDQDRTYQPGEGADFQRYEIRYRGATVVAYDTTVPPELTEAVRLLDQAIRGT